MSLDPAPLPTPQPVDRRGVSHGVYTARGPGSLGLAEQHCGDAVLAVSQSLRAINTPEGGKPCLQGAGVRVHTRVCSYCGLTPRECISCRVCRVSASPGGGKSGLTPIPKDHPSVPLEAAPEEVGTRRFLSCAAWPPSGEAVGRLWPLPRAPAKWRQPPRCCRSPRLRRNEQPER